MKHYVKKIYFLFFIIYCITSTAQYKCKWSRKISGTDQVEEANSVVVDKVGNVYVTGVFNRTTDFDPSAGTATLIGNGTGSLYLAKYDTAGNYVWAFKLGDNSKGLDLKFDINGDLILLGRFEGSVDFDPGVGVATLSVANAYYDGGFFAKYDINGNYIWAKNIPFPDNYSSPVNRIATDKNGNIYITATFTDTKDFDPSAGTATLTANSSNNLAPETFFAKYDNNGNYIWAKTIDGQSVGASISVDKLGNVYLTGSYYGTVDFDPNTPVSNLTAVLGSQSYYWDAFFAKYDSTGNYIWAKSIGGSKIDNGYDIINDSVGNIYLAGVFTDMVDFNPDPFATNNLVSGAASYYNAFLAKYDSNGNYIWANAYTHTNSSRPSKILLDELGYLYSTGSIYAGGSYQFFFSKYNSTGGNIWTIALGSTYAEYGKCIAVDTARNIIVAGEFGGTVYFDVLGGLFMPQTSNGTFGTGVSDAFFAKYKQLKPNNAGSISGSFTVCAGQTGVVYTVPPIANATGYNWALPGGATITNGINTRSITVSFSNLASSGPVSVNGINSVGAGISSSSFITVNPKPVINVAFSDTTICSTSSASLSANGANTYSWIPTSALNYSNISNPVSTPTTTTIYTVTGVINGCSNTSTVAVRIPILTISGNTVICEGSSATLTAIGMDSLLWSNGSLTAQNIVSPTTTSNYTVTGYTPNGCAEIKTQLITVNPIPNISLAFSDTTICTASSATLSASGANSYSWSPIFGLNYSNISNPIASPSLTTIYTVTGTSNGCSNTSSLTIRIPSLIVSGNTTVCEGDTAILIASGMDSFIWMNGPSTAQYSVSPISNTTYTVAGYTSNGCNEIRTQLVLVNPVLTSTINATLCNGESYIFGQQTLTTSGIYTRQLQTTSGCDSIIYLNLNINPTFFTNNPQSICEGSFYSINGNIYTTPGIYKDTLISIFGCDSIINTLLSVNLIDTSIVVTGFTLAANEIADSYQWIDCGNGNSNIANAVNQNYVASVSGSYAVVLTKNTCSDTSNCYNVLVTDVSKNNYTSSVNIFPNPTNSVITIITDQIIRNGSIKLFNFAGQLIIEKVNLKKNSNTLDLTELSTGIYYIELCENGNTHRIKIAKD
jgi:hypothetical protein